MPHRLFEETQRFKQVWIWIILIGVSLVMLYQLTMALTESNPATESLTALTIALFLVIGVNIIIYSARLKTKIDNEGVSITFKPLINKPKLFACEEIDRAFVRKYKPIWEYGGWGIRYRWSGRAYNTSGNIGLQLIMKSGKKILIGTRKPEELKAFLDKYIFNENENYQ